MNVNPELIFGIILAGMVCLSLLGKLMPERQPKEKTFKCARCKTISHHNNRTIEAWRNNKKTFFCQSCHSKWLQSRPLQQRGRNNSRSGCLGVIVLFAIIPIAGYLLMRGYT